MKSTFSAIIPAYQASDTIGRALESVLSQTRRPEEIIVCDDGSTDNLAAALEPYMDEITLVSQTNSGVLGARGAAIEASATEWVVLLDADDEWLPSRLQSIEGLALEGGEELHLITTDAFVRAPGEPDRKWYDQSPRPGAPEDQPIGVIKSNFVFGAPAIRRRALDMIGGFWRVAPHDSEYPTWMRMILEGGRAALVDEPLYVYHQGSPGQLSRQRVATRRTTLNALRILEGKYGTEIDDAIRTRSLQLRQNIAALEGVESVMNCNRRGCLKAATARDLNLSTRIKFGLAALAPQVARRFF